VSRPGAGVLVSLLAAVLLVVAACGESTPDAGTLLRNAQAKFNQTKSFHFTLTAKGLGAQDPLPVTQATGDVQRPDELSATATADVAGFTAQVRLIIIGSNQWITNPLTGGWQTTDQYGGILTIFDAQKGVGAILVQLQQPSTPQSSDSHGTPCWKITGKMATSNLGPMVGSNDVVPNQSVPTTVCIGKLDSELYSATLAGAVLPSDTAQTSRTFTLSNFDEPVSIQAPQT
jgi:LppX_LprAFG lipoprotein